MLPLFSGIYRMGAGLGPATAFLYSGPAINVLAIVMTAKVLGCAAGPCARRGRGGVQRRHRPAHGVHLPPRGAAKGRGSVALPEPEAGRPLSQTAAFFAVLVGILVFANWGAASQTTGFFAAVYSVKWLVTFAARRRARGHAVALVQARADAHRHGRRCNGDYSVRTPRAPTWPFLVAVLGLAWLTAGREDEAGEWFNQAWDYTKQIVPLLLGGVLVAGFLLGRPGTRG